MVAFNFSIGFYAFNQFTITGLTQTGNTNVDTSLQGATVNYATGATFTLNGSNPAVTVISVNDDDGYPLGSPNNQFADGAADRLPNGSTATTATNNQLLAAPVTVNGVTYPAGSQVEMEFLFQTTSVNGTEVYYIIRINGTNVGIGGSQLMDAGVTYTATGVNTDLSSVPVSQVVCFTAGTLIETPDGPRLIDDLIEGDLVTTLDHGSQQLRWIGKRHISMMEMMADPTLRPVRFETGAIGNDRPLLVSPQHRMLLNDWRAQVYFGEEQVLIAAKGLVNGTTIKQVMPSEGVTYFHLLFDQHEILISEGALSESFHPGDAALSTLTDEQFREIEMLFPELGLEVANRNAAYPVVRTADAKGLRLVG